VKHNFLTNQIIADFRSIGISLLLSSCCEEFLDSFSKIKTSDITDIAYVTLDDAVQHAVDHVRNERSAEGSGS